jgi:hypothetical protein
MIMLQIKKLQSTLPFLALAAMSISAAPFAQASRVSSARAVAPSVALESPGAQEFMAEEVASWNRSLETKRLSIRNQQVVNGGFVLRGTPSPAQRFNRAKLIPCQVKQVGGTFAAVRNSCDTNNPVFIPLSLPGQEKITPLAPGMYILGFENSVYPGFISINPGRATTVDLQQIPIPAGGNVKVYRDLTTNDEQAKLFFTTYTLGESLFTLAQWDFGDLYVKPFGIEDGARQISYKTCEAAKLPEMTVKGSRICRAWNQGSFMSVMEMFDFEPLYARDRKTDKVSLITSSVGAYKQWEVGRQGRPYGYRMGRLLVAKRTTSDQAQFVNVLPGRYMVEVVDASGRASLQATGAVGAADLAMNVGWLPQPAALKLDGKSVSAAPPTELLADGTVNPDVTSPEDQEGEFINPNETCASSKMWRTEKRAYCHSDKTEGCNRATAQLCEPTFDIP